MVLHPPGWVGVFGCKDFKPQRDTCCRFDVNRPQQKTASNIAITHPRPRPPPLAWPHMQMLGLLSQFEGTCLTFLVRGLGAPPPVVEQAFIGLPSDRFSLAHVLPYNPSFGFVADRLMLSWAVKNAGATAFVSTLYTLPFLVSDLVHLPAVTVHG